MTEMKENPSRVLVLGAGRGGSSLLDILINEPLVTIVGVVDTCPDAPAMHLAREYAIATYADAETAIKACNPCTAFNLTHDPALDVIATNILGSGSAIGGMQAKLIWQIVTRLKTAENDLRFEATHDSLTGIYNRRHLMQVLHKNIAQSIRYHFPYSIVMLDLDHFKSVNDTHGHSAGDAVLKSVVNTLQSNIRDADILGRWGGEEFLVLLPHTPEVQATIAAEKWLACVTSGPVTLPDGSRIPISFSAGVAEFSAGAASTSVETEAENLLHLADGCLYQAKEAGRNCITGGGTTTRQA